MRSIIQAIILLSFIVACQSKPVAPVSEEGVVLAKAGDVLITDQDLQRQIDRIEARTPQKISTLPQMRALVEQILNVEILYKEAVSKGFDDRFDFKARLVETYIESLVESARAKVTDERIQMEYDRNRKKYDRVSARHIILKTDNISPEEDRKKYLQIKNMRDELISTPSRFPDYAFQYSEDSSARKGGQLGFFSYDQMVPEFSKAAFALTEKGQVSKVVQTQYGYHLIQLVDKKSGVENFKDQIEAELLLSLQKNAFNTELDRLRTDKDIEIFDENILELSELPPSISTDPDEVIPHEMAR